ncbi:MAG: PleD family two-component system response regulator [Candidatus Brocadiia bacterium]
MADEERKPTILVIDDNRDALEILRSTLEEEGYRALAADTPTQGLQTARDERPDLVLLDIMMPEMSGFHVCEKLKAEPACEHIPVVMLTARKAERDLSYARTVGAADFLTKPVRRSQLLATIRKHLATAAPARASRQLGLRHLLAISTDPAFLQALSRAVEAHNFVRKGRTRYDLADAAALAEAKTIIDTQHPAAVIVDATAHNEGPDQIVRRLKTDPRYKALPLVVARHAKSDDLKFAWADARLPGRPRAKDVLRTVNQLLEP